MSTEEMFDVLNEAGEKTGEIAGRREVHEHGLWHTGMHLCGTDGRGSVFQQLRGGPPSVRILPNVWDLFIAAGHVSAGEGPLDTLLRESYEEVGLRLSLPELRASGLREVSITRSDYWVDDPSFPGGGYNHRVFDHNFVVRLPGLDLDTLRLEAGKVLEMRAYPIAALRLDLAQPPGTQAYLQHAHRPVDDERLYETVLRGAVELTTKYS